MTARPGPGVLAETGSAVRAVVAAKDRLRARGRLPWAAQQTHIVLAPYAVEEAYDVAEAAENAARATIDPLASVPAALPVPAWAQKVLRGAEESADGVDNSLARLGADLTALVLRVGTGSDVSGRPVRRQLLTNCQPVGIWWPGISGEPEHPHLPPGLCPGDGLAGRAGGDSHAGTRSSGR